MKRIVYLWFAAAMIAATLFIPATAQQPDSLGDYARAAKKNKKPSGAKQFDNDNLPRGEKLSVVGNASDGNKSGDSAQGAASADAKGSNESQGAKSDEKMPETKPGETAEERQKTFDQWKDRIASQKDKLALLSRELDVAQREYRLRAASFYADAGNRLRNAGSWDKEDAQYKQQIADKQKAVDEAKKELEDMQEEARKSGAPSSARE